MISTNKMLLIYPPISKKERYSSDIGEAGGEQIPLGVYYLASFLRSKGYEVKVVDAEAEKLSKENVLDQIGEFKPDYIGISSSTVAYHRALETAISIKEKFKDTPIILGGPHITSNIEHAMSYNVFDYGVLREGEITLYELLEALRHRKPLHNIKGIVYRENNELIVTEPREYIANLDELPFPAYDLIKDVGLYTPPPSNYKALPVMNMITSRGCPNQCTFCDRNIFGQKYRERSAENVFEEIKYLLNKYKVKEIAFVDDTFLINKKRICRLFELLQKEHFSFHWTCMSRINNVDYEFLKYIKSKGCWHLSFGIESGDENILRIIKKNITLERAEQVVKWCRQLNIKTKGFFIIGHPGETIDTLNKTIRFATKLQLDDIVATINTPIPGSPQYAEAEKYGKVDKTDWAQFNYWRPVFVPNGLSAAILLKKQKELYRRFYLRPRVVFRYLLSFFGRGGLKRFLTIIRASKYLFICQT